MKNKRLLHPKEAAEALGVSIRTLIRWDEAGKLRTVRTVGNQRRIPIEEISRLRRLGEGLPEAERCVLYGRVSSVRQEQDGNLSRQTERLKEKASERGYQVVQVITEQASSLNERRKGMKRLLALVRQRAMDVVLIENPERLVRFGFGYLEEAFSWQGVRLEVLDPPKQLEPRAELAQDLLTIVTVFADRLYGHRAQGVRKRVETVLKECEQEEETNGAGQPHNQVAP
jgi:putative resolvase